MSKQQVVLFDALFRIFHTFSNFIVHVHVRTAVFCRSNMHVIQYQELEELREANSHYLASNSPTRFLNSPLRFGDCIFALFEWWSIRTCRNIFFQVALMQYKLSGHIDHGDLWRGVGRRMHSA